jgi:uncharacterized membrane protein YebE (DUF533 family)
MEPVADAVRPEPDDDEPVIIAGIDARRLAGWIVVAGLVLGIAAAAFLVWEQWQANQAALTHNAAAGGGADVYPFAEPETAPADSPPPDPGAPPGPHSQTS